MFICCLCLEIHIINHVPPLLYSGINLGKEIDDIYEGITVAGINCQPYRESYVMTKRVTCMVDSPGVNDYKEGPIVVKVKGVGLQEVAGGGQQLVTYFFFTLPF